MLRIALICFSLIDFIFRTALGLSFICVSGNLLMALLALA